MIKYSTIRKYQSLILWLIFFLISLLFFNKSLFNFFVSDDFHWLWLSKNNDLNFNIFFTNYEGNTIGGSYSPLLVIIWKLFFTLFGLKYFYYHLVSIVIHTINGFLVYKVVNKLFCFLKLKYYSILSFLAGLFFLILPIQVETISWISAWPHLFSTLFYLLSLLFYFNFSFKNNNKYFYLSLLFFIFSLLIKEIALSLPFIILLWEIYFYYYSNKSIVIKKTFFYFIILFLFLFLRYKATGVLFGYYGNESLSYPWKEWIGNIGVFLNDFISLGYLRILFYKIWYYYLNSLVIVLLSFCALYFYYLLRKKDFLQFILFSSLILSLLLVSPLGLHRLTFAGERYLYLPSIFFILFFLYLLNKLFDYKKITISLILLILSISGFVVYQKNIVWEKAGELSNDIVNSYPLLELENNQDLISVALPDNLDGAEVFRNNLQQALELYYPDNHPSIYPLPVYTQLSLDNYNNSLIKWNEKEKGYLGESKDGGYIITGKTSITVNNVYFELWGYNYQNFTSNIIRLIPEDKFIFLTFDKGKLKLLE